MTDSIHLVDNLFKTYNYKISKSSTKEIRIYTLQYGMYHAAEIIIFDENTDITEFKKEFSEAGYATEIKVVKNISDVEEYLFEGFFIKTPLGAELQNRYKFFYNRQVQNLPEGSTYEYIDSSYDFILQNNLAEIVEIQHYEKKEISIIKKINDLINEIDTALFIIIEAPAGFGKTCTANEILNTISGTKSKRLPFFTELSRNREARVFKHILLNEIDEQFPNGIKQNVVLEQIYKGRIPLIIDGFDELITKETNKEDVESMLSTIVDLLKDNAKIIITSRKTAILSSTEFIETISSSIDNFHLARFEIKEPTIENWLDEDRLSLIKKNNFPINQISNPVLLSYIRNIPFDSLKQFIELENNVLIDKYFEYLLTREQNRQNLKLDNDSQFIIFRKLNRFMAELNFTADDKDTIKSFIKDYNQKLLMSSIRLYKSDERPTIDDLVETLSNHVLLDRKTDGKIGFINDFILGFLVAENLVFNKFQEHYQENFYKIIPEDFSQKAIEAYRIQIKDLQIKLWEVYNGHTFNYSQPFYFDLDYYLKGSLQRNFKNLFFSSTHIHNLKFDKEFFNCNFSDVTFENCSFNLDLFKKTSFQNCKFLDCKIECKENLLYNDFALYACLDNNELIEQIRELYSKAIIEESDNNVELTEEIVLEQFLQVDKKRPKPRKFSYIKERLNQYPDREITRIIDILIRKEFLHFKDGVGFITREAMNYLNHI